MGEGLEGGEGDSRRGGGELAGACGGKVMSLDGLGKEGGEGGVDELGRFVGVWLGGAVTLGAPVGWPLGGWGACTGGAEVVGLEGPRGGMGVGLVSGGDGGGDLEGGGVGGGGL